jgi:hypothetical protein
MPGKLLTTTMPISPVHHFVHYVFILGKGKNTSHSLKREEAFAAFAYVLKKRN